MVTASQMPPAVTLGNMHTSLRWASSRLGRSPAKPMLATYANRSAVILRPRSLIPLPVDYSTNQHGGEMTQKVQVRLILAA